MYTVYVYTVYVYTDLPKILKLHKIQCSSFFHFSRLVQELMAADAWQRDRGSFLAKSCSIEAHEALKNWWLNRFKRIVAAILRMMHALVWWANFMKQIGYLSCNSQHPHSKKVGCGFERL